LDSGIQFILRCELLAENLLVKSTVDLACNPVVEIDGEEFEVGIRGEFFAAARRKYDGFNIQGNYTGGCDDIALFSATHFNASEARLFINGEWTDWMDRAAAREFHLEICGLRQDKSLAL